MLQYAEIGDLVNIKIKEINSKAPIMNEADVVILPTNYLDEGTDLHKYNSSALSFHKYAKTQIRIDYLSNPEVLVEQRSGEWFGPALFFSSMALSENPELVSITCGVIANYLTDFFKGQKSPNIRLKVIHKETKTSKLTEISYEGGINGLDNLKETILEVAKK